LLHDIDHQKQQQQSLKDLVRPLYRTPSVWQDMKKTILEPDQYLDRKIKKHLMDPIDVYLDTALDRSISKFIPPLRLLLDHFVHNKFQYMLQPLSSSKRQDEIKKMYTNAIVDMSVHLDHMLKALQARYKIPKQKKIEIRDRIMVHILKKAVQKYLGQDQINRIELRILTDDLKNLMKNMDTFSEKPSFQRVRLS